MHILNTSLRTRNASETIGIAKSYADNLGITRVTDTTLLDIIGVPVFASIRPDADLSSLCVCAGKGLLPKEAEAGAYMEAIEFAFSERRYSKAKSKLAKVIDILDGKTRKEAILDFCPRIHTEIDLDDEIEGITSFDLISGNPFLVPAELVYMPYNSSDFKNYFGSHTNGLCSGNSIDEASIHGILEVVERDILSFRTISNNSVLVEPSSYPNTIREIHDKLLREGLELFVSYSKNQWQLPFFSAVLFDKNSENPLFINGGYGCHFYKNIALMRAVTEAIQSRMSFIHGGRDDLIDDYETYLKMSFSDRIKNFRESLNYYQNQGDKILFKTISEVSWKMDLSIKEYLDHLVDHLRNFDVEYILRVAHTTKNDKLQVVKVIIPKMEFFTATNVRVGVRLRDYASNVLDSIIFRSQSD